MGLLTCRCVIAILIFTQFLLTSSSSEFCSTHTRICMAVQEKFREAGVVPDVIDEPPKEPAKVRTTAQIFKIIRNYAFILCTFYKVEYDSGVSAMLGNELTPTQVCARKPPSITSPFCVALALNCIQPASSDILHCLNPQVQNAPTVTWPAEEGSFYTLIMTGQSERQFAHMLSES